MVDILQNKIIKIAIIGDSISSGLGKKKINFETPLKQQLKEKHKLNCEIYNFSKTGSTVEYIKNVLMDVKQIRPDIVVINIGNVDALVRPRRDDKIWKLIPKRYKKMVI